MKKNKQTNTEFPNFKISNADSLNSCHQCSILRGTQGRLTIMFHNGVPGYRLSLHQTLLFALRQHVCSVRPIDVEKQLNGCHARFVRAYSHQSTNRANSCTGGFAPDFRQTCLQVDSLSHHNNICMIFESEFQ